MDAPFFLQVPASFRPSIAYSRPYSLTHVSIVQAGLPACRALTIGTCQRDWAVRKLVSGLKHRRSLLLRVLSRTLLGTSRANEKACPALPSTSSSRTNPLCSSQSHHTLPQTRHLKAQCLRLLYRRQPIILVTNPSFRVCTSGESVLAELHHHHQGPGRAASQHRREGRASGPCPEEGAINLHTFPPRINYANQLHKVECLRFPHVI